MQATEKDLLDIMYIYKACVEDMNRAGLFNWNTAYPDFREVMEDIRKGSVYIFKENHVTLGVVCLNEEQPEEYNQVSWKYPPPFLVVHRLGVHPAFRNRKVGEKMMRFAGELAKKKDYNSIRLDAITVNPSAMRLYRKAGYEQTGTIFFSWQQDPFMCMEQKTGN